MENKEPDKEKLCDVSLQNLFKKKRFKFIFVWSLKKWINSIKRKRSFEISWRVDNKKQYYKLSDFNEINSYIENYLIEVRQLNNNIFDTNYNNKDDTMGFFGVNQEIINYKDNSFNKKNNAI